MSGAQRLPGFSAERAVHHRSSKHYGNSARRLGAMARPRLTEAACSYYYGSCAGPRELSCEFGDTSGICVGSGYAPVVVTCGDDVSYTEAPCVV